MKIIIIILFMVTGLFAQDEVVESTFTDVLTPVKMVAPTTYQVLLDRCVSPVVTDEGKVVALNLLLEDAVYVDSLVKCELNKEAMQSITNYKYTLDMNIRHKKLGRNYVGTLTMPVYKEKK